MVLLGVTVRKDRGKSTVNYMPSEVVLNQATEDATKFFDQVRREANPTSEAEWSHCPVLTGAPTNFAILTSRKFVQCKLYLLGFNSSTHPLCMCAAP